MITVAYQFKDMDMKPIRFGHLFFYEVNSGYRFKDIFSDQAMTKRRRNPVGLDYEGRLSGNIFLDGKYLLVVGDRNCRKLMEIEIDADLRPFSLEKCDVQSQIDQWLDDWDK